MITAIISSILGLVSGVLPDMLKEFTAGREHQRELEYLRLQNQMEIARREAEAGDKLRDSEERREIADIGAFKEAVSEVIQAQARPTGIVWIDAFNAVLRPFCTLIIITMFFIISGLYTRGVLMSYSAGAIADVQELANVLWGSMIGESIQAVLGFLFGYRSAVKR